MLQLDKNTFAVARRSPEANIFYLIATARQILRKQGKQKEINEMMEAIDRCQDYEEALKVLEYYGLKFIILD